MKTTLKVCAVVAICLSLFSCTKEQILSSLSNAQIVGTWQMTTSRVILKADNNGTPFSADQTRNGVSEDFLEINIDGTIDDPNDLFNTKTYAWEYTIKGNELILSEDPDSDKAYFTLKVDGNKMVWSMNTEQAKRSMTDTDGFNPVLNVDSSFKDSIIQNDFTIEFTKK